MRSAAQNVRDLVAGYGELWSTRLFARFLERSPQGRRRDSALARRAPGVVVEWGPLGPAVQWDGVPRSA